MPEPGEPSERTCAGAHTEALAEACSDAVRFLGAFFFYQASACSRRPPGARPQAAKWVRIFSKNRGTQKTTRNP